MRDFCAEPLSTRRLDLEIISIGHAAEAAVTFDSPALHEFTGGAPSTALELATRFARLERGVNDDATQLWLNWMLRERATGRLVGTVQATVEDDRSNLAWVVGVEYQRRGFAGEAARSVVDWLRARGVREMRAFVHPRNSASAAIAGALGLTRTTTVVDSEHLWTDAGARGMPPKGT